MDEKKDINIVAMEVILNSGDGRDLIDEALDCLTNFEFEKATSLLDEAEEKIVKAHIAQTQVIQAQVGDGDTEYSLLFIHAQDTLMTINSELRLTRKMLLIFRALYEKNERSI